MLLCPWPAQLLAASVWLFRADIAVGFKAVAAPKATAAAAARRGGVWVPICMMYVPVGPHTLSARYQTLQRVSSVWVPICMMYVPVGPLSLVATSQPYSRSAACGCPSACGLPANPILFLTL